MISAGQDGKVMKNLSEEEIGENGPLQSPIPLIVFRSVYIPINTKIQCVIIHQLDCDEFIRVGSKVVHSYLTAYDHLFSATTEMFWADGAIRAASLWLMCQLIRVN